MKTMTCVPVIQRTRFRARLDDYSTERFSKEVIVLRFTASLSARSVCMGWGKRPFGLTPRTLSLRRPSDRRTTRINFLTYRGIASHRNFRDDRFDSGPAFDWGWLGT